MRASLWAIPLGFALLSFSGCADDDPAAGTTPDATVVRVDGGGLPCVNTCAPGTPPDCKNGGARSCADLNGDGCTEWSQPSPCAAGENCVLGQCVSCTNDCVQGSFQCGPSGGVMSCNNFDDDPCFEWGDEQPCPATQSCSAGECRAACIDECQGTSRRCNNNGFQVCEEGANGCRRWGQLVACAAGETCSLGECRASCVDECSIDTRRCNGDGYESCDNFDEDSCLEWSNVVPCPDGEVCSNGRCAATCVNECGPAGSRQCSGAGFQVCDNHDDDECLEWGQITDCGEGQNCSGGRCQTTCTHECAEGTLQCSGDGVERCGNFDDDDCLEWSEAAACDEGEVCSNGECRSTCANECGGLNERRCNGDAVQTCGNHDADTCLEWSTPSACAEGQSCSSGRCVDRCVNECPQGAAQCANNGVQTCGNFDDDECFEWGGATPCAEGQTCSSGRCVAVDVCEDECARGVARCAPGGLQTCGDFDEDACNDWGPAVACPQGETCSNGACAARCSDECPPGALRCAERGFQQCGQYDDDDCAEWSAVTPCAEGEACSNGVCALECDDECGEGSVRCSGNGVQRCGDNDEDVCQEWLDAVPCPANQTCSGGVCTAFCIDECDQGATRCGDNGVQTCGDYDEDRCREWSVGVACPVGQVCSNGQCAVTCVDECAADQARCEGNGVQRCGDFDVDDCLEWSAAAPCGEGRVCSGGVCEDVTVGCASDADCAEGQICLYERCLNANECDADADCAANEICDLLTRRCETQTPSLVGDACAVDADCGEGGVCLGTESQGYCSLFCTADEPCPTGASCYIVDEDSPDIGLCVNDCARREQCDEGQACYPSGGPLGGLCYLNECVTNNDCLTSPLIDVTCVEGRCLAGNVCDINTGEGCAEAQECVNWDGTGVCLDTCVYPGPACADGLNCAPSGESGLCLPAGLGGDRAPCETHLDCALGFHCMDDGVGGGSCRALCDAAAGANPCGEGDSCVNIAGRAGVCLESCVSECSAGDDICDGAALRPCGNFDEDLCLELGAAIPCAEGEGCNALFGACQPACVTHEDCEHPLVGMRCEAGNCAVISECDPGSGEGCVAPAECFLATNDGLAGVCLEICDPIAPACSVALEACVAFGTSGYCLKPGDVPQGGQCDSSLDCAAGLGCVGTDDGAARCFTLCDAALQTGCANAEACVDLGLDGRVGVCVAPCEDTCPAEGATDCGDDGRLYSCGYHDGVCLSWGAPIACDEGEICPPGESLCMAGGCTTDEDCTNDMNIDSYCDAASHTCLIHECLDYGQSCGDSPDGVCIGFPPSEPTEGLCLNRCAPGQSECGMEGICDWWPVGEAVEFVCLPAGPIDEYGDCAESSCGWGMMCTPFEPAPDEIGYVCLYYCDVNAQDCDATQTCEPLAGLLPDNVGVCVPTAP